MLGDFGWIGTEFDQTGGDTEGLGIGSPVAERAGVGGEAGVKASGRGRRDFPSGHFEKAEENPGGGRDFGHDEVQGAKSGVADVVINDDIDRVFPVDGFFPDPFPRRGVEDDEAIRFVGKLVRDVLNEFTPEEKTVHGDHAAFDMKGGGLAAVAKSVGKTKQTAKGVPIGTEVGEERGGFSRGETVDHLLRQSLVHKRPSYGKEGMESRQPGKWVGPFADGRSQMGDGDCS